MPQFPDVLTLIGALAGPLATAGASSGLQLEDAPATAPVIPAATGEVRVSAAGAPTARAEPASSLPLRDEVRLCCLAAALRLLLRRSERLGGRRSGCWSGRSPSASAETATRSLAQGEAETHKDHRPQPLANGACARVGLTLSAGRSVGAGTLDTCMQQLGQPVHFGDRDCQLRMPEDPQRIEAAYRGAERDAYAAVPVGSERQAPVSDRQSRRPRGLQEGIRPSHRHIGDVRQRC
jgi:hypothetical protein